MLQRVFRPAVARRPLFPFLSGGALPSRALSTTQESRVEVAKFVGATTTFTPFPDFVKSQEFPRIPCFRVLDSGGNVVNEQEVAKIDVEDIKRWYREMLTVNIYDKILHDLHRQGRIVFYAGNAGEEGTHIGTASALTTDDIVYSQYREIGVLLHRGWPMENFINQCLSNNIGHGKGRQVPVHYGSKELNFHTVSSPLGVQVPQASGAGFALKDTGNCVLCFFGEGAASEGDVHAALNFAATLDCPVIFFCRNNGYAISTPASEQYKSDGIASRAVGYGMDAIRVDGNDVLAVHIATQKAKEQVVRESRPMIIEAMTYRIGDHSTSDDASAYRSDDELEHYRGQMPIERISLYLTKIGEWDKDKDEALRKEIRSEILTLLPECEKNPYPSVQSMFDDVFSDVPDHLLRQRDELNNHLEQYKEHYDLSRRAKN